MMAQPNNMVPAERIEVPVEMIENYVRCRLCQDVATEVKLNAGDVFVFRGDLLHAGGEYVKRNIRVHCYVDSPCAPKKRDKKRTYTMHETPFPIRSSEQKVEFVRRVFA